MKPTAATPILPLRAIVIHSHAHAAAALQAVRPAGGEPTCRLLLLSAQGAASYLGPAWWAALIAALQPRMNTSGAQDMLDCGDAAGRAMEALRLGLRRLVLSADCPQYGEVLARGAALGAQIIPLRPPCLDLAEKNAARRLPAWLQTGPDAATRGEVTSGRGSSRS